MENGSLKSGDKTCNIYIVSASIIVLLTLTECSGQVTQTVDVQWTTSIRLNEYRGYQTVSLTSLHVPAGTIETIWDIQCSSLPKSCPVRTTQIYFQHGGYPLVSPYNASYPADFYLNRSDLHFVEVKTNNLSHPHHVTSPKPGTWFVTAFLPKTQEKITQKGLNGKTCGYGMGIRFINRVLSNIEDVSMTKHSKVSIQSPAVLTLLRFLPPEVTTGYTLYLSHCVVDNVNVTVCPVKVTVSSEHLPNQWSDADPSVDCREQSDGCHIVVDRLVANEHNYVRVDVPENVTASLVEFHVSFSLLRCKLRYKLEDTMKRRKGILHTTDSIKHVISLKNSNNTSDMDGVLRFISVRSNDSESLLNYSITADGNQTSSLKAHEACLFLPSLGTLRLASEDFASLFVFPDALLYPQPNNKIFIPDNLVLLTHYNIFSMQDSGSTLKVELQMVKDQTDPSQDAVVWVCMMKNVIPGKHLIDECEGGIKLTVNSSVHGPMMTNKLYVPYPEEGRWYFGLHSMCFNKNKTLTPEACKQLPMVSLLVFTARCVDEECGTYGQCQEYISGLHVFSACSCYAGYRGYGCTDATEAESDTMLLLTALLLTLSNLFFIPSIFVAIHRRLFVEALVYSFTMFFSTFYHACDTKDVTHYYCMMKYDVLSYCDFLGSIMSFWVTILAMARLSSPVRSFFHMLGALCLALGVEYDRHGLWVFVVPAAFGIIIMSISWVRQCCLRKNCYPSKWRYVKFLLPGVLFAGTGLVIFAFLETEENYKYTHSAWHIVMALSIVFLLPSRQKPKGAKPYMQLQTRGEDSVPLMDDYDDENDGDDPYRGLTDPSIVQSSRNVVL
ncbi:post-GPI attachment to proteins factor 6-like isoform X1 [Pecten maximus]|uniref:post-GPI attachment to proteins factor 6-like isoform X1 n=1 Tax=Pecten maximus TaxID=6579 RepID=UPI001457EC27|nr:post-GPI attachment to proteins factor 6-like isoform X1 [Pecten maximus]